LTRVPASRAESRVSALLHRLAQRLDDLTFRLESALRAQLRAHQTRVAEQAAAVLLHDPRQGLAHAREHLSDFRARLERSFDRLLHRSTARLNAVDARLNSLSPLAVLDRGYALVLSAGGSLIRSAAQLAPGETVTTRLADGAFTSRVESATTGTPTPVKKGKRSKS
jgi:exodeoxyribonuclease VII large subunit